MAGKSKKKLIIGVLSGVLVAAVIAFVLMKTMFNHSCPEGQMVVSNKSPKVDEEISFGFENTAVTSWEWDFGDGNMGTKAVMTHVYAKPGSYTVILHLNGSPDCSRKEVIEVKPVNTDVTAEKDLVMPVIEGPGEASTNEPVNFKETSGKATSWSWGFGESLKSDDSKEQNPSYTFKYPGPHKVTLFINGDNKAVAELKIDVVPGSAAVKATPAPVDPKTNEKAVAPKGGDVSGGKATPAAVAPPPAVITAKPVPVVPEKAETITDDQLIQLFKGIAARTSDQEEVEKYVHGNLAMNITVDGKQVVLNSYLRGLNATGDCKIKTIKQTKDKKGYISKIEITQ